MTDLFIRFLIGGIVVCLFSALGDIFRPKSFAGLFSAAPSIAIATLSLTVHHSGSFFASTEARSMMAGAFALALYAAAASFLLARFRPSALLVSTALMPLWLAVAFGLWQFFLR